MSEERGLIGSLFDLSFTDFVTTRIIKFLFILAIIFSGIEALAVVIAGFASGSTAVGILTLLLSPVIFFLGVLMARVWLELIIVVFRIAENTGRLPEQKQPE